MLLTDTHGETSPKLEVVEDRLRRYLALLPGALSFENYKKIKVNVFKACYFALTGEGTLGKELFPGFSKKDEEALRDYAWDPMINETRPFYKDTVAQEYTHAKGLACARIIQGLAPLYRCLECFYDESCVLCEDCYNPDDHIGHEVEKYSSMGGGMCDCGDDSAFLVKLTCRCLRESKDETISPQLQARLELVLSVVLDYIIDVGSITVLSLPIVDLYLSKKPFDNIYQEILDECTLPTSDYGPYDKGYRSESYKKWNLVLWLDLSRVYTDDKKVMMNHLNYSEAKARELVDEVRANGSVVIKESDDFDDMINIKNKFDIYDLIVTITTSLDNMREHIVLNLILWLEDLNYSEWNFALKTATKSTLAELLLRRKDNDRHSNPFGPMVYPNDYLLLGLDTVKSIHQGCKMKYKTKLSTGGLKNFDWKHLKNNFECDLKTLDIDRAGYLLAYELRFPSKIRTRISNMIILALLHDSKYKDQFCFSFLEMFPSLLYLLAMADRDIDQSCINTVSIQVFMCPPTNSKVINSSYWCNLFLPVINLMESHASHMNSSGFLNLIDVTNGSKSLLRGHRALTVGIETVIRIFTKNDSQDILEAILDEDRLVPFVLFQSLFQGIEPFERVTGNHVEHEDFQALRFLVRACRTILVIIKATNQSGEVNTAHLLRAIGSVIDLTARPKNDLWLTDTPVTQKATSFINPMGFFLCILFRHAGIDNFKDDLVNRQELYSGIYDYSLQSIVLAAQVKIGTWIRNGEVLARMSSLYSGKGLADLAYYNDFHLVQIGALVGEPSMFFLLLLKRWELDGWFEDKVAYQKTVYEDKFAFACEQFILFLYNLLCERYFFDSFDTKSQELYIAGKTLRYRLAEGPQTFSSLWAENKSLEMPIEEFTAILRENAEYSPPQGVTDTGIYRLKPELFKTTDPISLFLDSGSSQSTFGLLLENISKTKKVDISTVCLEPQITLSKSDFVNAYLGAFLKTPQFAKFAYKLIQVGLDEKDEGILTPLLHLIHALILDDEKLHTDKSYINQFFIQYPICNLLFSIAESSISPGVSSKAEYLLDIFISKDENVIQLLSICFGELHIKNYTQKKREPSDKKRRRSKEAVEARKAKILSKFAKQRQVFLKSNDLDVDINGPDDQIKNKCVSCGELETTENQLGIPFTQNESSIRWFIPDKESDFFQFAFENYWDVPSCTEPAKALKQKVVLDSDEEPAKNPIFPVAKRDMMTLPYSCSHMIHTKCCLSLRQGVYACPLCDQPFKIALPTYYYPKDNFIPSTLLKGKSNSGCFFDIAYKLSFKKNDTILHSVLHNDYFENGKLKGSVSLPSDSTFSLPKSDGSLLFHNMDRICELLANLISSHEKAVRLEEEKGMSNIIESLLSSTTTLARSLIQSRVLFFNQALNSFTKEEIEGCLARFGAGFITAQNDYFREVVTLFFQTDETLQSLIRIGVIRLIIETLAIFQQWLPIKLLKLDSYEDRTILGFHEILRVFFDLSYFLKSDNLEQTRHLYKAIQKVLVPFLRKCVIFSHVLTCSKIGDNEYLCLEEFEALNDYNKEWTVSKYIDCLSKILEIPSLDDVANSMSPGSEQISFEKTLLHGMKKKQVSPSLLLRNIEFPNVQRLITIPDDYAEARRKYQVSFTLLLLCLHCGEQFKVNQGAQHRERCTSMGIFYGPRLNSVFISLDGSTRPFDSQLPGPYMTEHGEVKRDRTPGFSTLNKNRYRYLNKIWINNELYGLVARSNYDAHGNPLGLNIDDEGEEEDDHDDHDDHDQEEGEEGEDEEGEEFVTFGDLMLDMQDDGDQLYFQ